MKVIVAGFPKTGTTSMNAALTELGYSVRDYLEHFVCDYDHWNKIANGEGTMQDFKTMYENVDAVMDSPAYLFWHEIHQAFPDAKIILTTRDAMSWYKSLCNHLQHNNNVFNTLIEIFSARFVPISRRFLKYISKHNIEMGVTLRDGWFRKTWFVNEMYALQKYRKHNAYVMKEAPKDKLLVYSVKEGWEPLCKFLGKEVPKIPFPHENIGGKNEAGQMSEHEFGRLKHQQMIMSLTLFMLIGLGVCYLLSDYPAWVSLSTFACGLALLFLFA